MHRHVSEVLRGGYCNIFIDDDKIGDDGDNDNDKIGDDVDDEDDKNHLTLGCRQQQPLTAAPTNT